MNMCYLLAVLPFPRYMKVQRLSIQKYEYVHFVLISQFWRLLLMQVHMTVVEDMVFFLARPSIG